MCLGKVGVITAIHDDDGVPMALIDAGEADGLIRGCLLTCRQARAGDTVLVHSGYVLQAFDPGEDV